MNPSRQFLTRGSRIYNKISLANDNEWWIFTFIWKFILPSALLILFGDDAVTT